MRKIGAALQFNATDLVGYLNCRHLAVLDRAVAEGALEKPKFWDPVVDILWQRGAKHEANYIEHLVKSGLGPVKIAGIEVTDVAVAETLAAMKAGSHVIVQGALAYGQWVGRADVLRRVEVASALGSWSYEPVDTKLARETRAGSVLQLCLYADLLAELQGRAPDFFHVVIPWSDFEPQRYRYADYSAYFRKVKREMLAFFEDPKTEDAYPEPIDHCEICRWRDHCDERRRKDDHPCLVAGISKLQINELRQHDIKTMRSLASIPLPLNWKPDRGSADSYIRIREQARLQVEARESGKLKYELLAVEQRFGLSCLPAPSPGDIFLDFEGDPFVGEGGIEYLFGYLACGENGDLEYIGAWALSREAEKKAFEQFVDFVVARWEKHPGLHIYHYAPYEPSALKRLMGRYATREEELDRMLRAKLFVDLYQVVRRGLRASVETYSIKSLEPFYGFERETSLHDANVALASLQAHLELDDVPSITDKTLAAVQQYNRDDCRSAAQLRDWLEVQRERLVAEGVHVGRPAPGDGNPNDKITAWLIEITALIETLTADVPVDAEQRSAEQQARWLLANVIDWHRREDKAVWWEYFRLADLAPDDLLQERAGLAGLTFVETIGGTARAPVQRYAFTPQETELRGSEDLYIAGGAKLGKLEAISFEDRTIDIKKRQDTAGTHPDAIFAHTYVSGQVMADALVRIGEYVAEHGVSGVGPYQAARDLLLRIAPRVSGEPLHRADETPVESAIRLSGHLEGGILPIQGPPGAGKTFTGAQMICELVSQGKVVGVTANSHKVVRNLIDEVIRVADEKAVELQCCQKADEPEGPQHRLSFVKRSEDLIAALGNGTSVGGGTAWLWSRPDAFDTIDVLFVDEAAQMSLANVLAASQAARMVVLIGDPQQLDQPTKGTHPDGADASSLDHVLAGQHTISSDKGLFLDETWRLHPLICSYTSEVFYDNKLKSREGLEKQAIRSTSTTVGSGLRYIPVAHRGNQNCSPEEAEVVEALVRSIIDAKSTWINREGQEKLVELDDILIIAPYNAQVFEILRRLPAARVGTVDKFQGQQAPIAIYSMATSSHADAPRGMEFLYSLNRLNVATSRARCISILVCSPTLFEPECRTPRQIQLTNGFCRLAEMAEALKV